MNAKPISKIIPTIRRAVADYMRSEGCSCCRSDNHGENAAKLAKLLRVPKYSDSSGYDWKQFQTPDVGGWS